VLQTTSGGPHGADLKIRATAKNAARLVSKTGYGGYR
jgi:hypothetical protein